MDRILEQRLFVGQEVTFDDAGTPRRGFIERIDDSQVPAQVTVRRSDGCNGCRVTRQETAFEPATRKQHMVPPRAAIVRMG